MVHIDPQQKIILGEVEIITKGFLTDSDIAEVEKDIKSIFVEQINNHLQESKYVNWNELKNQSRDELNKFLYKELRRRPITMPVLISVEDNDKDKA